MFYLVVRTSMTILCYKYTAGAFLAFGFVWHNGHARKESVIENNPPNNLIVLIKGPLCGVYITEDLPQWLLAVKLLTSGNNRPPNYKEEILPSKRKMGRSKLCFFFCFFFFKGLNIRLFWNTNIKTPKLIFSKLTETSFVFVVSVRAAMASWMRILVMSLLFMASVSAGDKGKTLRHNNMNIFSLS